MKDGNETVQIDYWHDMTVELVIIGETMLHVLARLGWVGQVWIMEDMNDGECLMDRRIFEDEVEGWEGYDSVLMNVEGPNIGILISSI